MLEYSVLYIAEIYTSDTLYSLLLNSFQQITRANTHDECIKIVRRLKTDIVVIDLDSSYINGIDIVRAVKGYCPDIQVVLTSSKKNIDVLISAIDLSVSFFLHKPIKECEYIKCINKVTLARQNQLILKNFLDQLTVQNYVRLSENCIFYTDTKKLKRDNKEVMLNNSEIRLCEILIKNRGNMVTYEQIENYVWNDTEPATKGALRNLVYSLRKKLPAYLLENRSKIGYVLKAFK